jgi:hypothetical protein
MRTLTRSDLDAAIAARLRGFNAQAVEKAAQALFTLTGKGEGSPLDENALAAFLDSFGMVPAGNVETVSQALIATAARDVEAWHVFYLAAYAVLEAHRQAERARGRQGGDALDGLLRKLIAELPEFSSTLLWAECVRRADGAGCEILFDYDSTRDLLTFEHHGALTDIGFGAFRRRVQRIRRHKPAVVAPVLDHARHQQIIRKAA